MLKMKRMGGAAALLVILTAIGYSQSSIMLWNVGPNLQFPRDTGAAVATGGTIYLFGGNTTIPTSVETLAPGASVWTNSSPLQTPRIGACASVPSFIGVVGGKDGRRAIRDLTNYNPVGLSTNVKSMLTGRYLHACAFDSFGRINAIGGKDAAEAPTATVEVFTGRAWIQIASLPETRFNFSAASDGLGNILTFGGTTPTSAATNTVNRLDGSGVWGTVTPMPIATSGSAVVVGANKLIYVIGGNDGNGPINAVQIYHIASDSWTMGAPLPVAVSNASAVIDASKNIVVIGGVDATNRNVSAVWTSGQEFAPPIINSFPNTFARAGSPYTYQATSTGNPAATYSLSIAPVGMTIDSTTGLFSWTPDITQVGVQNVTVTATNLAGSNDQSFAINVLFAVPPAPTGFTISNITANGASLSWNPLPPELGAATYNLYELFFSGRGGTRSILIAGNMTTTLANVGGLAAGSGHSYAVTSVVNGVESAFTARAFFVTLQPGAPTNVAITGNTQGSITLSWTAPAASQVPIVGYRIYESTATGLLLRVDNITDTFATVAGLLPNTVHNFYVVSFDANLNQSFLVAAPTVTTVTSPILFHNATAFPRAVGGGFYAESLVAVIGDRLMLISTDAHSPAGVNYVISFSGSPAPTFSLVTAPAGMTIDPVTGVVTWTSVSGPVGTFTATARGANSEGFTDFNFTYTVYPAGTDLLSPTTVPMFLATATNVTRTSATLNWNASTDNVGVAGYRVYAVSPILICGTRVGCPLLPNIVPIAVTSGTGTTVTLNNLTRNTGYSYWIEAFDAAGNTSFITQGIQRNFTTLN